MYSVPQRVVCVAFRLVASFEVAAYGVQQVCIHAATVIQIETRKHALHFQEHEPSTGARNWNIHGHVSPWSLPNSQDVFVSQHA
jgi:hypothetical protein